MDSESPRAPLILLVDDYEDARVMYGHFLRMSGYEPIEAATGEEALELAYARIPDLILLDMSLPGIDGWEVTAELKGNDATKHIPIVALTAHAMQGDRERCLKAGMDGYLSKPIDVDRLIATIEEFGEGVTAQGRVPQAASNGAVIFDEPAALSHTGGDRKLLKQIVDLFRADSPASFRKIERALKRHDGEALWTAAHALKGSMATIGAQAARQAAADIERSGRAKQFDDARRAYMAMRHEVTRLDETLTTAGLIARPKRLKKKRTQRRR